MRAHKSTYHARTHACTHARACKRMQCNIGTPPGKHIKQCIRSVKREPAACVWITLALPASVRRSSTIKIRAGDYVSQRNTGIAGRHLVCPTAGRFAHLRQVVGLDVACHLFNQPAFLRSKNKNGIILCDRGMLRFIVGKTATIPVLATKPYDAFSTMMLFCHSKGFRLA